MIEFALNVGYLCFGFAFLLALWRLIRGPQATDRLLALDTLYVNALGLVVLAGIGVGSEGRSVYFEVALLIALIGALSTIAGARFLARGDAIE